MHNASHGYPVPHITKDKTKNIMKFDIYYIKSDGSDFWVHIRIQPVLCMILILKNHYEK